MLKPVSISQFPEEINNIKLELKLKFNNQEKKPHHIANLKIIKDTFGNSIISQKKLFSVEIQPEKDLVLQIKFSYYSDKSRNKIPLISQQNLLICNEEGNIIEGLHLIKV